MDTAVKLITTLILYLLNVGLVWLVAMVANPDLSSGTVWFFAVVVGILCQDIRSYGSSNGRRLR